LSQLVPLEIDGLNPLIDIAFSKGTTWIYLTMETSKKLSDCQMKLYKVKVIVFGSVAVVALCLLRLVSCPRSMKTSTRYTLRWLRYWL
jgi:hypothetical protein